MKDFIKRLMMFILLIAALTLILVFFYERPIKKAIDNKTHEKYIKFNNIHQSKNAYNLIVLGSSRGYCAYDPTIIDGILNITSYNMSSGSQNTIESYFILKDILQNQSPDYLIYDIFLPSFSGKNDFYQILSTAQFLESFTSQKKMILQGFGFEGLLNYFIPILPHKNYIKNTIQDIVFNVRKEDTGIQKKWISGYFYDESIVDPAAILKFSKLPSVSTTYIVEKKRRYFKKIIALCRAKNIRLICVRAPYPPSRIKISPKDTVPEYFYNICNEYQIPYFDFNVITDPDFQYSDTDFSDQRHMNYKGAQKVSKQLAELLKKLQIVSVNANP